MPQALKPSKLKRILGAPLSHVPPPFSFCHRLLGSCFLIPRALQGLNFKFSSLRIQAFKAPVFEQHMFSRRLAAPQVPYSSDSSRELEFRGRQAMVELVNVWSAAGCPMQACILYAQLFCHLGYSISVFGQVYSTYVPPHFLWPTIRATVPALTLRARSGGTEDRGRGQVGE
ncbi:hypothetical protein C8R45DRAFT_956455 [Mycena sanguinolenta]|nr:hypothetical protein C8R45DRAFT_956455 [Mycena sanguinolenta]